jgi:hypothetical protein
MKKLTKKVGGQRMMKTIEAWYGLNKSTPDAWFDRWEVFINHLLEELGFKYESCSVLEKPRGKEWKKELSFNHSHLGPSSVVLKRKRRQEAGMITLYMFGKTYKYDIETGITPAGFQYKVMSRQDLGDKIISSIRHSWELHTNATNEKS